MLADRGQPEEEITVVWGAQGQASWRRCHLIRTWRMGRSWPGSKENEGIEGQEERRQ